MFCVQAMSDIAAPLSLKTPRRVPLLTARPTNKDKSSHVHVGQTSTRIQMYTTCQSINYKRWTNQSFWQPVYYTVQLTQCSIDTWKGGNIHMRGRERDMSWQTILSPSKTTPSAAPLIKTPHHAKSLYGKSLIGCTLIFMFTHLSKWSYNHPQSLFARVWYLSPWRVQWC